MLKNWIKIYFHQIKNNKFFTALNILGLSIGIAGLIFSILYWNDEHSYNDWNPEKENIFATGATFDNAEYWPWSVSGIGPLIPTAIPEIESFCYLNTWYNKNTLEYNGKKIITEKILDSQKNFFSFFPFEFISGNSSNSLEDAESTAISEETAKKLFGDENPIGKQILLDKKYLTVKGIYKIKGKSTFEPAIVTSQIDPKLKESEAEWSMFQFGLFIKLKNPEDAEKVRAKIENLYYVNKTLKDSKQLGISAEEYTKKFGSIKVFSENLKELRFTKTAGFPEGKGNFQFLVISCVLSVLILLLSIFNYINLATANAIKRAKEVGIRKILGATKSNIVLQFIFETVLAVSFAILFALVIVELALPFYNQFLGKEITIYQNQFYIQLLAVFGILVLFSGIFPALYVANFELLKILKGNFSRSRSGVWIRNGMLVLQFTIASFFIVGSYIVNEQISFMNNKNLGFDGEQVIEIYYRNPYDYKEENYKKKLNQKFSSIKTELLNTKGVQAVSAGTFTFGNSEVFPSGFKYNETDLVAQNMATDFGILNMMKIHLKEGRDFSEKFSSDTINTIIINETTLKLLNIKNPIGKEIQYGNELKLKIIGVVTDFHLNGPQEEIPPMVFFHFKTFDWMLQNIHSIYIKVDPKEMEATMTKIEKLWTLKIDPEYPFKYDFVDKNFKRSYENFVHQKNLFSLLNFIVIMIALFGLFALASYSIERKMKEIAIRKTLGAETKMLLKELSKQYILFLVVGFFIALFPAYFLLNKWLENFAYRIEVSIFPFVIGFIVLLILTLAVVLSRAYQATRVNILKYLKYE